MTAIYYDENKNSFVREFDGKTVTPEHDDWLVRGISDAKYLPNGLGTYQYGISMTKVRRVPPKEITKEQVIA